MYTLIFAGVYIAFYSLQCFLSLLFTSILVDLKFDKAAYIKYIALYTTYGVLTKMLTTLPTYLVILNTLFSILFAWLLNVKILKMKKSKGLYLSLLLFVILALCEIVSLYIISFVFGQDYIQLLQNEPNDLYKLRYTIFALLTLYMTFTALIYLIKVFKIRFILTDRHTMANRHSILITNINLLLTLTIVIPNVILLAFNVQSLSIWFYIYNIFLLIVVFLVNIYVTNQSSELVDKKQELYNLGIYNRSLTGMVDGMRLFKHDFNNIIQAIGGYLLLNDIDGLSDYFSHIKNECTILNNLNYLKPEVINEPAIYGIISAKYYDAIEKGIKFDLDVVCDVSSINIPTYDFSRILGIFLDNAIEASNKTDSKFIKVTMRVSNDQNYDLVSIANSCIDDGCSDINDYFKKGFSSKAVKSGLGLWEVKKTIDRLKYVELSTMKKDYTFTQELSIRRKII